MVGAQTFLYLRVSVLARLRLTGSVNLRPRILNLGNSMSL